jgi:hypothetical protein
MKELDARHYTNLMLLMESQNIEARAEGKMDPIHRQLVVRDGRRCGNGGKEKDSTSSAGIP